MADPATLAIASGGAQAGGSLISALGAQREGAAQAGMLNYQAGIAQLNQKIALQNRDYALASGESQAAVEGMKQRAIAGTTLARQGASGIDVGSGSSTGVRAGEAQVAGIDLATIRNNAARRAYGYSVEAAQDTAQAGLYQTAAQDVTQASKTKMLGSLISGAGGVADKWLQYQTNFGKSSSGGSSPVYPPDDI